MVELTVTQAKDAIKTTESKGEAWFRGSFTEQLFLDLQVTNAQCVLRDVASDLATAVSDPKLRSILLVGRRAGRVVFLVKITGDGTARRARDP
jgi:hypothetical protein